MREYRQMAAAFADRRIELVNTTARRVRVFVESLHARGLTEEAERAWAGHRAVLRTGLHQMEIADELDDKRVHFSHVSEAIYCAVKSFGGVGRSVFVSYSPRAFDDRGAYWLSDTDTPRNPYAPEQTSCAEMRETI